MVIKRRNKDLVHARSTSTSIHLRISRPHRKCGMEHEPDLLDGRAERTTVEPHPPTSESLSLQCVNWSKSLM
jgi:hypothetical protein